MLNIRRRIGRSTKRNAPCSRGSASRPSFTTIPRCWTSSLIKSHSMESSKDNKRTRNVEFAKSLPKSTPKEWSSRPAAARHVLRLGGRLPAFSYSRKACPRSHNRYTLCGYHGVEDECDKTKDWRQCQECLGELAKVREDGTLPPGTDLKDVPDKLWRGLNYYNSCPLRAKNVPKHSLCERCGTCKNLFMAGIEGSSGLRNCRDCGLGGMTQLLQSKYPGMDLSNLADRFPAGSVFMPLHNR